MSPQLVSTPARPMRPIHGWIVRLSILLALLVAAPAAAAPPVIETFHNADRFVDEELCDFPIQWDFVERIRVTTWYNAEGEPIRAQTHVNYVGTITNLETGKTVRDPGHYALFTDLETGTTTFVGLFYNITIPGHGTVVREIGRVVWDAEGNLLFQAGPNDIIEGGFEVVCPALAGT